MSRLRDVVTPVTATTDNTEQPVRDGRRKSCCSISYAAYYPGNSPRDVTVLFSSLHASPAWLDMVRRMNKDVCCDSTVWTDFTLTTEMAYLSDGTKDSAERSTAVNAGVVAHSSMAGKAHSGASEDREEHGRGGDTPLPPRRVQKTGAESVSEERPRACPDETGRECIPPQARLVLRRYFYDEFCYRLATSYGVPTLLVFRDRLRRGLELSEDDRNHMFFVDSMLLGVRFVAAMEITRPSLLAPPPQPPQPSQTSIQQTRVTENTITASSSKTPDVPIHGDDDRAEHHRRLPPEARNKMGSRMDYSFENDDDYIFDEYEVSLPPTIGPHLLRVPDENKSSMTEKEISDILESYELEINATKPNAGRTLATSVVTQQMSSDRDLLDDPNVMEVEGHGAVSPPLDASLSRTSTVESEPKTEANMHFPDDDDDEEMPQTGAVGVAPVEIRSDGDMNPIQVPEREIPVSVVTDEAVVFKHPSEVDEKTTARVRSASRKRRLFRDLGNRAYKENLDISDREDGRVLTDTSSDEEAWNSRPSARPKRPRAHLGGDRFDLVGVEFVSQDAPVPGTTDLERDTLLFVYRLERRSGNVVRFVRVARVVAATTTVPVDTDSVTWDTDDLMHELRKAFGDGVTWLGRRREDPDTFQIRNLSVDVLFGNTVPNMSVLLRRARGVLSQPPVRL